MQNLQDDNNLDRLSREAAAGFEVDQEMHSWDKLRPALDAAMPEKKRRRRFFFILFLFLLVGGGITVSAILFNDKDNRAHTSGENISSLKKSNQTDNNNQVPETAGDPSSKIGDNKPATENQVPETSLTQTPIRNTEKKDITADPIQQKATEGNSRLTDRNSLSPRDKNFTATETNTTTTGDNNLVDKRNKTKSRGNIEDKTAGNRNRFSPSEKRTQKEKPTPENFEQQTDVTATGKKAGTRTETLKSNTQNNPNTSNSVKKSVSTTDTTSGNKTDGASVDKNDSAPPGKIDSSTPGKTDSSTPGKINSSTPTTVDTTIANKADGTPADKADSASTDNTAAPLTTRKSDKPSAKKQKASPLKNRWEFGATFAPDVSTVKFTHTRPPGLTGGITIGYNISRRFSIQTGAMYTAKNYKSDGKDYHPPKGYWTDYVKLETVTGECDMWDIPINLRYNVRPAEKYNLFVSAGLSSYIMKNEDYEYFYYYNGNPVTRARSYNTDEKYWLSVLNFSLGYERQVSRNFSLQVEPFFKQPLKGVGFGSLKLNSTGIFFTVKYKPLLRQARPKA